MTGYMRTFWVRLACISIVFQIVPPLAFGDMSRESIRLSDGTRVRYAVVLPDDYDPEKTYPAIMAFPGGGQSFESAQGTLRSFIQSAAEERGYIAISPGAPSKGPLYRAGKAIFPEFLEKMAEAYSIEGGKFHIFGISNGGITAFDVAANHSAHVRSVTVIAGYLPQRSDTRYEALLPMCIAFMGGERDTGWVQSMRRDHGALEAMGKSTYIEILPGEGHVPGSLRNNARVMDIIDNRAGCASD